MLKSKAANKQALLKQRRRLLTRAMVSHRPYRKALSQEEAHKELSKCSGSQFDPAVVNAFLKMQTSSN